MVSTIAMMPTVLNQVAANTRVEVQVVTGLVEQQKRMLKTT